MRDTSDCKSVAAAGWCIEDLDLHSHLAMGVAVLVD